MPTVGERLQGAGYSPNLPLLVVPGLCSSILKVKETTYEPWMDKRVWLNLSAIGMGKVWDFNVTLFGDSRKKKKEKASAPSGALSPPVRHRTKTLPDPVAVDDDVDEVIEQADVDDSLKRRWIKHMVLQEDGVSDPPGIKLRAVEGLRGCAYLEPSNRATKALSYVFGPFFEMLQEAQIGYDDNNLQAMPYDWRIPPCKLQERDGYFDQMAENVVSMKEKNGKRVVLLGHSLGTRVVQYFLRWAAADPTKGREWIDAHVETFIAVGPIFLGAPKTFRALVTGERMGLEAFLFPEEGLALNRRLGSIPWMFPTRLHAEDGDALMRPTMHRVTNEATGGVSYQAIGDEELMQIVYPPMYDIYKAHYEADPLHGPHAAMVDPLPVSNLYAIYGINLETESFCFVRDSTTATGEATMELDPDGRFPSHKCKAGIGFETKDTPQKVLLGEKRSGDGTVPYASLAYCKNWEEDINVRVDELEQCDHRDILKDKRFLLCVAKYICRNPPPPELPESFPDLKYPVTASFGGRKYECILRIQRPCISVTLKSRLVGQALQTKVRYQAINSVFVDDMKAGVFIIDAPGASRIRKLRSKYRREIVEEIASRCRYADRLEDMQDELGEEDESLMAQARREERDAFGQTALHRAASENNVAAVKEQTSLSLDVNSVDANGWTPLHCAAKRGHIDVILVLLANEEVNTNMVNKEGLSALHYIMQLSQSGTDELYNLARIRQVLDCMMSKGTNINLPSADGDTALHKAALRGNLNALEWLLKNEVDVNATNKQGDTAMHIAIRAKQKRAVLLLSYSPCNLHLRNRQGESALQLAAGSKDLFGLLCKVSAAQLKEPQFWLKSSSDIVRMGLFKAIQEHRLDWAYALLRQQKKEAVDALDRDGCLPVHKAARDGPRDILELLLHSTMVAKDTRTKDGDSVVHLIVEHQAGDAALDSDLLLRLLELTAERGEALDATNGKGESPLHVAVRTQRMVVVDWLLSREVEVDQATSTGETALHYAVRVGDVSIIKKLVDGGADVNFSHAEQKCGSPMVLAATTNRALVDFMRPKGERKSTRSSLMIQLNGVSLDDALQAGSRNSGRAPSVKLQAQQVANKRCTAVFSRKSTLRPSFSGEALVQEDPNPANLLRALHKKRAGGIPTARGLAAPRKSPLAGKPVANTPTGSTLSPNSAANPRAVPGGRGRRGGIKIDMKEVQSSIDSEADSKWGRAMSVINTVNADLEKMTIEGCSANKAVTVVVNGMGAVQRIDASAEASETDRIQALNIALGKQRRAAFSNTNKALEHKVSKETLDVLNGCMYASSQ